MRRHSSKPELPGSITSSSTQSTGSLVEQLDRRRGVAGGEDVEAGDAEEVAQQGDDVGLVLDHQDRRFHRGESGAPAAPGCAVFADSSARVRRLLAWRW